MAKVKLKPYASATLVLLALDWKDGARRDDFLGFAIKRSPGFGRRRESWLPNRIGFQGPARHGDFDSDEAPIQRFLWWDARIDDADRGKTFTYTAWAVVGKPGALRLLKGSEGSCSVALPQAVEDGIGTWFNRAVVSSQAFSRKFFKDGRPQPLTGNLLHEAEDWLANGMQEPIPDFLEPADPVGGAIYHLTDDRWVIPALKRRTPNTTSLVYDATKGEDKGAETNQPALDELEPGVEFKPRTAAKIMHDKFLVRVRDGKADAVLMGSANFTTAAMTTQANVVHTFASPELAELYLKRKELLEGNPTMRKTRPLGAWSDPVAVGAASVRVFFPPEPTKSRESIDTIVRAVNQAHSSVVFCIFSPTDQALRDALFAAGDAGKMMFGLINKISPPPKPGEPPDAAAKARVETYNRSRDSRDVFGHSLFTKDVESKGFWFETNQIPGTENQKFPVFIHHKFIVIDAETETPTIYTGSANMSEGSLHGNDENLLEIKGHPRLAHMYLAEFMRLYEHYRARAREQRNTPPGGRTAPDEPPCHPGFALAATACWAKRDFTPDTPECKSRLAMTGQRVG